MSAAAFHHGLTAETINSRNMTTEYPARQQMQLYTDGRVTNQMTNMAPNNNTTNSNVLVSSPTPSNASLASYETDSLIVEQQQQQQPEPARPTKSEPNVNPLPHFEYVSYDRVQVLYEQKKGTLYFIPEGFEPVLVPNDSQAQSVTNLLQSSKQVSAPLNVSRMLPDTDVRLPSLALPCGVTGPQAKPNANNGKSKVKKPPRPPNAFILYRRAKQPAIVAQNQGITNNEVSKEIGRMWHEEPNEVRVKFQKMAEAAKQEHMQKYPEYRYRPRRPQERKRRVPPRDTTPQRRGSTPAMPSEMKNMMENQSYISASSSPERRVSSMSTDGDNNSDIYMPSPTMTQNLIQQQLVYGSGPTINSSPEPFIFDHLQNQYVYMSQSFEQPMGNTMIEYNGFDQQQAESYDMLDYDEFGINGLSYMPAEENYQSFVKCDYP